MQENRICKKCGEKKELNIKFFLTFLGRDKKTSYFKHTCRDCERKNSRENNRRNPERVKQRNLELKLRNPTYSSDYKKNNIEKVKKYNREYEFRPYVKLKKNISRAIMHRLKAVGSYKTKKTLEFLPYTIEELKAHLEKQFDWWMNWDNWGPYNKKTWDDNDQTTWTWHIDHIKPMARHVYNCQDDPEFLEAWKLENLRPLNARENIILGAKMKKIKTLKEQYGE